VNVDELRNDALNREVCASVGGVVLQSAAGMAIEGRCLIWKQNRVSGLCFVFDI
jgi:hypothetical protein